MPLYEHVFLARQDISQAQVEALTKEYSDVITEGGGKVGKTEYWGLKTVAFKIKKNRKAHYSLMNLEAPPAAIAEMERRMGLSPDVIRFITIRVDEHETEPSIQMRKSDRDERGRDGDRGGGFRRRSWRLPRRRSAVASVAVAAVAAVASAAVAAVVVASVVTAKAAMATVPRGPRPPRDARCAAGSTPDNHVRGELSHGRDRHHPRPPALPSPPQDLPLLRR